MNNKRKPSEYSTNTAKKIRSESSNHVSQEQSFTTEPFNIDAVGNDTKSAVQYVRNLFPVELFENRLPPIIIQHQLYSFLKNRTRTDKEIGELREAGEIRLFKLGAEETSMCIVFLDDYKVHVQRFTKDRDVDHRLIDRFLSLVVSACPDVSFSKQRMSSLHFTDDDITQLVKACVLTVRDVGSWWLAIPSAGIFTKTLNIGRRALIAMIQRCKYREILQSELESRKLPKAAKLGMKYHMLDVIGADQLESVSTTSGPLLRLRTASRAY